MGSDRTLAWAARPAGAVRHLVAGIVPAAVRERLEAIAGRLMLAAVVLTLGGAVLVSAVVPHARARRRRRARARAFATTRRRPR